MFCLSQVFWKAAVTQYGGIFSRGVNLLDGFLGWIHHCPHSADQGHVIILDFQFLLQLTGF